MAQERARTGRLEVLRLRIRMGALVDGMNEHQGARLTNAASDRGAMPCEPRRDGSDPVYQMCR